jgi:hypothetical protein
MAFIPIGIGGGLASGTAVTLKEGPQHMTATICHRLPEPAV